MEKEFVSYEQAVALKELGLNIDNYVGVYGLDGRHLYNVHGNKFDAVDELFFIKAPLKQQVFRWFREYYWWYANLSSWLQEEEGTYHKYEIYGTPDSAHGSIMFKTYEEAESACIDKLIELAKQ
jgi:hypothetical protein